MRGRRQARHSRSPAGSISLRAKTVIDMVLILRSISHPLATTIHQHTIDTWSRSCPLVLAGSSCIQGPLSNQEGQEGLPCLHASAPVLPCKHSRLSSQSLHARCPDPRTRFAAASNKLIGCRRVAPVFSCKIPFFFFFFFLLRHAVSSFSPITQYMINLPTLCSSSQGFMHKLFPGSHKL